MFLFSSNGGFPFLSFSFPEVSSKIVKMKSLGIFDSALLVSSVHALGQKSTVNFNGSGMELASGGSAVQILCERDDWPAVLRVCDDLARWTSDE